MIMMMMIMIMIMMMMMGREDTSAVAPQLWHGATPQMYSAHSATVVP
jgi:hypothetical protein